MIKPINQDDESRQQLIAINKEDSRPVLAELSQAGFEVEWISDLYNKRVDYRKAIPILLHWLPLIQNPYVKEGIVRALSVPWAKRTIAPKLLVEEFRKAKMDSSLKWAIGNALSVVADDSVLNDLVDLIRDKSNGTSRQMLVVALGNMKTPNVDDILIEELNDEDLAGFAIIALGKMKSSKARSAIEPFLAHHKAWVRKEAQKSISKIDKTNN